MQHVSTGYMLRHQSSLLCVKGIHLDTNDSNLQERTCIETLSITDVKCAHSRDRCRNFIMRWMVYGNSTGGYFYMYLEVSGHSVHLHALQ